MKILRSALDVVRDARRPYVILHLAYYGIVVLAMGFTAFNRSLQQQLLDSIGEAFSPGPLAPVWDAYVGGQVLIAVALTFLVNLVLASFMTITLPSLVIPFSGFIIGGLRAATWGLLFSPELQGVSAAEVAAGAFVAVLVLLEGEGYILALLAAFVHGRAFLWPGTVGAGNHKQGYWLGLKRSAKIYLLVAIVLLVAAVYEVLLVVVALPRIT